jgi:hypothetical protein
MPRLADDGSRAGQNDNDGSGARWQSERMRKVRVVISGVGTAMPTLVAFVIPAIDACGSIAVTSDASTDATTEASKDASSELAFPPPDTGPDVPQQNEAGPCPMGECTHVVPIPAAGTFPDLTSVCAVASPVVSNTAAILTLSNFDQTAKTVDGFIAIPSSLLTAITGFPVLTLPNGMIINQLATASGGYTVKLAWTSGIAQQMSVKVTFQVVCSDGGVQTVESTTDLELCGTTTQTLAWESSGSNCIQCCVVCEMAPTPIVSDNAGDHLPLGRALRLRVVELARAGKQVVLFAQNDAGSDAEYDWRVSGGSIECLAPDVVVWTLPDEWDMPFGQLAVSNDEGAIVENFYWGAA